MLLVGYCAAAALGTAAPYVQGVGIALTAIGVLLFILWAIFCAVQTPCGLMLTVQCLLFWINITVGPAAVVLSFIFDGLPCQLATLLTWGGWGTLYAVLVSIMIKLKCQPTACI